MKDGEVPPLNEQILRSPESCGIKSRYNPWNHYIAPVLEWAPKIVKLFPDVKVRVYLANDLAFLVERLANFCEIFLMRSSSIRSAPGMLWRFLAMEDGDYATILDADLMASAAVRIRVTQQLKTLGLSAWRVPVPRDESRRYGVYYRPIAGYGFGAGGRFPMRDLLLAFWWHLQNKTLRLTSIHPLTGRQRKLFGSDWPNYGTDEFFLLTTMYPRLAHGGLLSFLPLTPKVPRSFLLLLDIEYATWANRQSSIDYTLTSQLALT